MLIICAACGCSKTTPEPEKRQAAVIFDIGFLSDGETKAQTAAETNVTRLQVALYNEAGELEWDNTYEYAFVTVKTISGLTEGPKTIVAVANKAVVIPEKLDDFYTIPVTLGENRRDAFVMYGSENAVASVTPELTTIHLKRSVVKISVRSSLSLSSGDGKTHEFIPERIYLSNVATRTNLRGDAFDEFINLREDKDQTTDEILRDFTVAENTYWVNGAVFNHGVDFYVCTNTSQGRPTAMIIQAKYDGNTCYYPLVVAPELLSNTMYKCGAIKITCEGMPNPEDDFSSLRVRYNYETSDWNEGKTDDSVIFE